MRTLKARAATSRWRRDRKKAGQTCVPLFLETKKAIDLATQYGVASCIHNNNGPITLFADAHAAAAGDQFLACEYHMADVPHLLRGA